MACAHFDAVVLGGGFFGCELAIELRRLGLRRVLLYEREAALMRRASYANQARVHNGYHYPRSLGTAERSHKNFERFVHDYDYAITFDMDAVYAIASTSRVNAAQFASFCAKLGVPCDEAPARLKRLFDDDLIEEVFLAREFVFNADAIAREIEIRLAGAAVEVRLSTAARVDQIESSCVTLTTAGGPVTAGLVVNCTYAGIDDVGIQFQSVLKRELAEMVLIQPPHDIARLGVTVMDGPFFSTMPFPAMQFHTLSHVRYTPHAAWTDCRLGQGPARSNATAMVRDAARYLPCLRTAVPLRSIFDVKTVLTRNERDDGRPVLFEVSPQSNRILTVMGSKIDNIYDAIDALRSHRWDH
jgi:glycine/D-amino acid oxidase-like deaminating enzyme